MRSWLLLALVALTSWARAEEKAERYHEGTAVLQALQDLERVAARDRFAIRYIYCRDDRELAAVQLAANTALGRSAIPIRLPEIGRHVLRVDFRYLATNEADILALIKVWEELRDDRYFRDVLERDWVLRPSAPYRKDGKEYRQRWVLEAKKVRPSAHAGGADDGKGPQDLLVKFTKSEAPIVDARHFSVRATSTVDLGFGAGLYYRFRGIQRNAQQGKTDLEVFLAGLGADEKASEKRRSDQSTVIFTSGVTGKPRQVIVIRGDSVGAGRGQALVWITRDPSDEQVEVENDPIRNLLGFGYAATEVIAELASGFLVFALFDANGNLQDSAPDNVVKDHTVPPPYTARLQGAISCLRCHGPQGAFQPLKNDLRTLLSSGVDIFDDFSIKESEREAVHRIVQLYQWRPDLDVLPQSRLAFDRAVFAVTRLPAEKACSVLSEVFNDYAYHTVTTQLALQDLGFRVKSEEEAKELFSRLVPRAAPLGLPSFVVRADPILASLRAGIPVTRPQWERVYSEVALRVLLHQEQAHE